MDPCRARFIGLTLAGWQLTTTPLSAYESVRRELSGRLQLWMVETSDPLLDGDPQPPAPTDGALRGGRRASSMRPSSASCASSASSARPPRRPLRSRCAGSPTNCRELGAELSGRRLAAGSPARLAASFGSNARSKSCSNATMCSPQPSSISRSLLGESSQLASTGVGQALDVRRRHGVTVRLDEAPSVVRVQVEDVRSRRRHRASVPDSLDVVQSIDRELST
jgi:hypothetical protein